MSTRIRLRAWDIECKEMINNASYNNYFNFAASPHLDDRLDNENYIIMLSTWIHDKNWKEIYEDDIVSFLFEDKRYIWIIRITVDWVIIEENRWLLKDNRISKHINWIEVIWNTYENTTSIFIY